VCRMACGVHCFFFSSRRRHTRSKRDWSSDVCSSDLPPVNIKSGDIGGPSAGLMFSLEIYNQLTEKDITKGYNIAGTGAIDSDGNVERIGSIDKKVVAADEEGVEIFFAPNEQGVKE